MTPEELAKARSLVEAATLGPWYSDSSIQHLSQGDLMRWTLRSSQVKYSNGINRAIVLHESWYVMPKEADQAFIAEARTMVPQLLDEIERLQFSYCDVCMTSSWVPTSDKGKCRLVHPHTQLHQVCGYCALLAIVRRLERDNDKIEEL